MEEQEHVIRLPSVMCFITEFPSSSNRTLCLPSNSSDISNLCYTCPLVSSYLSRDIAQGRQTCYSLWILILVIGSFAVVTNCLNIVVLLGKAPSCGPSLTSLLIPLSIFDMIASGFAIGYSTLSLVILENMSRSWLTMMFYHLSLVTYLLGRTGSLFMAILITIERYLVVAHPLKMKIHLSVRKTRAVALLTCVLAVISNVPRYFSVSIEENLTMNVKSVAPLHDFPYLFRSTWLGLLFFKRMVWLGRVHFLMDFLLPLPVLLILNLMLFTKIRQANLQRRLLSPHQRSEIASAKMFGVVVTILLLCHLVPITFYTYLTFFKQIYRELSFATTLSVCVNAAVNFPIFFAYGRQFRKRFVGLFLPAFGPVKRVITCLSCGSKLMTNESIQMRSENCCYTINYQTTQRTPTDHNNYGGADDDDDDNESVCTVWYP